MNSILPIHERFHSFQGEGCNMGLSAFFIRTFGCPVHCPWCDSAGTWHKDWVPKDIQRVSVDVLADEALQANPRFVIVTGGEPAVHDLSALTERLHFFGLDAAIETSGAFPITGSFDWKTVSPKRWKLPTRANVINADEFKFIIEEPADIAFYYALVQSFSTAPVWLHPEWSRREDAAVLGAITEAVKANPQFRAGWQLHKLYRADARDKRTQPLAPLGGDTLRGY